MGRVRLKGLKTSRKETMSLSWANTEELLPPYSFLLATVAEHKEEGLEHL